jgi:hypothetical protein
MKDGAAHGFNYQAIRRRIRYLILAFSGLENLSVKFYNGTREVNIESW